MSILDAERSIGMPSMRQSARSLATQLGEEFCTLCFKLKWGTSCKLTD